MAAGKPVIATRPAGRGELIEDGTTGILIPPGDKVALARQTRRLLENELLRRELGEGGRSRLKNLFSLEKITAKYIEAYQSLAPQALRIGEG
jgi:starch synthase